MLSTIETLSDEVLMHIFQYSTDIPSIFRAFLGLNQRLNRILVDKRLHLLTNYLLIKVRDDYYNSEIFQHVTQQLLSVRTTLDEEYLSSLLRSIVRFYIRQKYLQCGRLFQSSRQNVQSIREQRSDDELLLIDEQLRTRIDSVYEDRLTNERIEEIRSLVLIEGARYEGEDYELTRVNFTKLVNRLIFDRIENSISMHSIVQLLRTVLISNPSLIKNRDYVGNGGCVLQYFLIFALYRLYHFYHCRSSAPLNMKCYRATIDLYLFVLQCQRQTFENQYELGGSPMDILSLIMERNVDLFVQSAQWQILEIVMEKCDGLEERFANVLANLIDKERLDVIVYIHRQFGFRNLGHIRPWINVMTCSPRGRRYFGVLINELSSEDLLFQKDWIFILLEKKERKLLEKLIRLSPALVHQLDEEGNDPLLYIALQVNGCRHRIVDFLLRMGADFHRKNIHGQSYIDALQLSKNRNLSMIKDPYHP